MKLLNVGTIAYDCIKTPFGGKNRLLGGSAVYFALAASYFCKPAIVSIVGKDFLADDLQLLRRKKIDTSGIAKVSGKTFAWGGEYGFDLNNRTTLFTHLNVLEKFNPIVPESLCASSFIFLGNTHPALQQKVLLQLKKPKFIACDTMNFWIEHNRAELGKVLSKIDALIINDSELRELAKEYNVVFAAKKILKLMGKNKTLVLKRGEYGVLMFYKKSFFYLPAYPLEEVYDPTGAGDSFAGGFMGYLAASGKINEKTLKKACVAGSVVASFCVEKMGTEGLQNITNREIQNRLGVFKTLTHFE